jgi:hypothetical protein
MKKEINEKEFETTYDVKLSEVFEGKETINGIDFFTLPLSTNVVVQLRDGQRFAMLKPYKYKKRRENAIKWALEQFEKNTLKPLDLKR